MQLEDMTIILPTKNEAANIGEFLVSIPEQVRLLVVDASTDNTRAIIAEHRRDHTRIIEDRGNIAAARQLGATLADTQWLLFTDADVVFDPTYFRWLEQIRPSVGLGAVIGAKFSRQRYKIYYRLFSLWMRVLCGLGIPAASGSNLIVNRVILNRVGGFDTQLTCNEDSELTWRIHKRGFVVRFDGRLRVYERDHRRLDAGMVYKTVHSLMRCVWLFSGRMNGEAKRRDWGYWRHSSANMGFQKEATAVQALVWSKHQAKCSHLFPYRGAYDE